MKPTVLFTVLVVLGCGPTADDPGATDENIQVGNVPRILSAYEVGEQYLRYALEGDERIVEHVRCADAAVQSGSALRQDGVSQTFESVRWIPGDGSTPEPSQSTPGSLRYRLAVNVDGESMIREGSLSFAYDDDSRSLLVVCPTD